MVKSILVIDDDSMNLKMAEFILKQKKYRVLLANSGAEGLIMLRRGNIDLVLLDIEMPDMNGIETLENIRKESRFAELPVMFLTASGEPKDVLDAVMLGALDYIKKPFLPQDLLERVGKVFENK